MSSDMQPAVATESNLPATAAATTEKELNKIQEQNEFNQLKEEVSKLLSENGTLPKLKAQLKYAVLQAIRQQKPPSDNGTAVAREFAKRLADSEDYRCALALVDNLLEAFGLNSSKQMLRSEVKAYANVDIDKMKRRGDEEFQLPSVDSFIASLKTNTVPAPTTATASSPKPTNTAAHNAPNAPGTPPPRATTTASTTATRVFSPPSHQQHPGDLISNTSPPPQVHRPEDVDDVFQLPQDDATFELSDAGFDDISFGTQSQPQQPPTKSGNNSFA